MHNHTRRRSAHRSHLAHPWLCLLLALLLSGPVQAQPTTGFDSSVNSATTNNQLRYPRSFSGYEQRDNYVLALLQLALTKAGSPLIPTPSTNSMAQNRALAELAQQRSVDVVWAMTSREREAQLLPVRISIDKGLMGWRIALLAKQHGQRLKNIQSLADLQQLQAGQGHDWPDRTILASNGLPVQASSSYEGLFHMLAAGRFDYFPRSLLEVSREVKSYQKLGLQIDPYLLLHYPTTSYFFVSPNNPELAETLRVGLERALADGSFDQLFYQYYGAVLRQLKLSQRRILELENPLLPAATPLSRSQLWLSRTQLLHLGQPSADQ